jgi:shikimate dehydrogenase
MRPAPAPARTSRLIGLIGSGVGPSLSPQLHEREGAHHGLQYVYRSIDIAGFQPGPDTVGEILDVGRRLGFDGFNVTHPCKQSVLPFLDELSDDARRLGAVNTVTFDGGRSTGHNTDWHGFARSFARGLPDVPIRRVVQLGAGGAGAAVAHALLTLGVGELVVVDTTPGRAAALAAALSGRFGPGRAVAAGDPAAVLAAADGLVHATPTGMAAHPGLPLPAELLRPQLWVAEIVYRPLETALLREARRAGCRTLDGSGMVVFQAAEAFRLFTGIAPDAERMLAHAAQLIRA